MKLISPLLLSLFFGLATLVSAQTIANGPMLGYCEMNEVAIWIQTDTTALCAIAYWPSEGEKDPERWSDAKRTYESEAYTAVFILRDLEPGTTYNYGVIVGEVMIEFDGMQFTTQTLWQYRTDPPDFSCVIGSCNYVNEPELDRPGDGYGGDYEIFETIAEMDPDMMLWLGDNTYFREADLNTWSGMLHRYTHTRDIREFYQLLKTCHHYAIWDDHDFGPNDSNGSWIHKDRALEAFKLFWANNSYGFDGHECITSSFSYNDVDFFLLDNRTFRTHDKRKDITPQLLGDDQINWLIESLMTSKAPFKLVAMGGQCLSDFAKYETYAMYPEEQEKLIGLIEENDIEGVVFLTGDRHHTELSKMEFEDGREIYDITASPLTSTSYDHAHEENTRRVKGTIYGERNFVRLDFSGERTRRVMTMTCYDVKGKKVWSKEIKAGQLKAD